MITAELPKNCDIKELTQSLASAALAESDWSEITIEVPADGFVDVGAPYHPVDPSSSDSFRPPRLG